MKKILTKRNIEKVLDYIGEGIQIIDKKGKIVYCNLSAANLDNVNRDEAIGKYILDIYPSLTEETSTLLKVIKTGEPIYNFQQTFLNYKGYKITTINSSIPIIEEGEVLGALEISRDITQVKALSEKVVDLQKRLYDEETVKKYEKKGTAKYTFANFLGESKEIQRLKTKALRAAQSLSSIMVYGSTGTGKELIVQSIHNASSRSSKPFIAQNCAAIPASLLEGILFGTSKGSFTGADDRPGLFELANGGTLFLDEINSMPIELQSKLLRVLEEGTIRRVGDIRTRPVDVRIIAAMNMNPMEAVEKQYLRNDLFYRLNVVSLKIPDLKDRKEDIPLLVDFFIKKFNKKLKKQVVDISPKVKEIFYVYHWPGNVRELENIIEGIMNISEDQLITEEDLPYYFKNHRFQVNSGENKQKKDISLKEKLQETEKQLIREVLQDTKGNVTTAAKLLGIPRQTLQYKLQKHKIK
ncbi:sigma-54 interaction domain-containing protein [Natronincola ferrireducens]|uniref:Arginine utilization regulatory protein n=1 Tax=Natronincola ferrireducens TaxID=393762 RepID=A0A1G9FFQ0_9FIRM|nr:sigma 54-interacting transcriptional regulator [Natronincola ferrireducens]SDK87228.1 arginine utilization regulatory protein [Natronincola ferrireducens]